MEYIIFVVFVVIVFFLLTLYKRVKKIEENEKGLNDFEIQVYATEAFLRDKHYGELIGLPKECVGKPLINWSKKSKEKVRDLKIIEKTNDFSWLRIRYLASINSCLVEYNDKVWMTTLSEKTNTLIDRQIAGIFVDNLWFRVYINCVVSDKKIEKHLVVCLKYLGYVHGEDLKDDFSILCDFPIFERDEQKIKDLGFEIERNDLDQTYKNDFGEGYLKPYYNVYKKNGVEINFPPINRHQ